MTPSIANRGLWIQLYELISVGKVAHFLYISKQCFHFRFRTRNSTVILYGGIRMHFQTDKSGNIGDRMCQLIFFIIAMFQFDKNPFI